MTSNVPSSLASALFAALGLRTEDLALLEPDLERWEASTLTPAQWNARFLPHYFGAYPPADLHRDFDAQLHNLHLARGTKRSVIAPRGAAKSTWKTLAYPLRCALEGWEPYTAILSDCSTQANNQLRHIRMELETNARLAAIYPTACAPGAEWNESKLRLKNGAVIEAFGTGKKIRGHRNRSARPSLIIFDDVQSNADIRSAELRQHAWDWATRDVLPAGDERTNFLAVGSALHRESVAVKLGQLAGWTGHTYRAVRAWPERMDLWEEFERLTTNLADGHKLDTARAFYLQHQPEMDRGADVYWPDRFPIVEMMLKRAEVGATAFESEYQGVPGTLEGAEWPAEYFDRPGFFFDTWPADLVFKIQSLDPSKGTSEKSDYQAHVMLALSQFGTLFADCELRRESGWVERAIDIAASWRPEELIAEVNNTMGLFAPTAEQILKERRERGRPVALKYTETVVTRPKSVRIRAINDYLRRGQLRIKNTPGGRMLADQLRDFPHGDHDDGPDALATAVLRMQELVT
ncbi:hypothetical protein [Gemmata palustris]|uniref:hypothetical protein n=1 Tax=Gemmata palustris TaxID=2822762 RepID=UPI001FEB79B3|nr:hypothetical protein [Gemmata palustris]